MREIKGHNREDMRADDYLTIPCIFIMGSPLCPLGEMSTGFECSHGKLSPYGMVIKPSGQVAHKNHLCGPELPWYGQLIDIILKISIIGLRSQLLDYDLNN